MEKFKYKITQFYVSVNINKRGEKMTGRLILLNAFPVNAFEYQKFEARFEKSNFTDMKFSELRCSEIRCYIRHPATLQLINNKLRTNLQPSSGLYQFQRGDEIYVVTLKAPERGKEMTAVTENDIEIWKVSVKVI
jgi:Trk K+ transport system NAD-binding subunit